MKLGLFAVAVLAAVLDHQVVDALASAGFFASAHAEYRHVGIVPAFVGAATLLATLAISYVLDAHRSRADRPDWLPALAARLKTMPAARMALTIFVLQCCSLYAMESFEQFAANGHLAGPSAWLGASVPIALAIGLCVAAVATAALRAMCDVIDSTVAMIARIVEALVVALCLRARRSVNASRAIARPRFGGAVSVLASRSGLRAPPLA